MIRTKDAWLDVLDGWVSFVDARVVDVGCGDGKRSALLARQCRHLIGIEPDSARVKLAQALYLPNAQFVTGDMRLLRGMEHSSADVVTFLLSFHHLPRQWMGVAIDYALWVLRPSGRIVFLEPGRAGSYFAAEVMFDVGDGDERDAKAWAYAAMSNHPRLRQVIELHDTTEFVVESRDDFMSSLCPRKNLHLLDGFLQKTGNTLMAHRRINVYKPA